VENAEKAFTPDPAFLLQVRNLKEYFPISTGFMKTTMLKAVDDVSFDIRRGETLGLVGESGCGKTTVGRTILQLYKPTAGEIWFGGKKIDNQESLKAFRRRAQMVFQDPYSSLNPRMRVADIVAEPIDVYRMCAGKKEREARIHELMNLVGLNTEHAARYAHELSGGQRQRIGIARALASRPDFIICDEPVSALDVSIQAQVINMLEDLQNRFGLTYLFIAHDISVVKHISNRIAVMYLGHVVEMASAEELTKHPLHPYTVSLLSAVPIPDPKISRQRQRIVLKGDVPSPLKVPSGCPFRPRCERMTAVCKESCPAMREAAPGHYAACHHI